MFIRDYELKVDYSNLLPQLSLTSFIVLTYAYQRFKIKKADSLNFTELLWKIFLIGLITTVYFP